MTTMNPQDCSYAGRISSVFGWRKWVAASWSALQYIAGWNAWKVKLKLSGNSIAFLSQIPSMLQGTWQGLYVPWWRHQLEILRPVNFPHKRPVTRSFDDFSDRRLDQQLSKQLIRSNLRHHRAHYDVIVMTACILLSSVVVKYRPISPIIFKITSLSLV